MQRNYESLSFWQLIHNYGHTELSQYEERICTRPQQAVAPMMIDGLSERAFCCACAVASTMISWFSLPLSSSFLNSPAKPMIEKLLSSQLIHVSDNRWVTFRWVGMNGRPCKSYFIKKGQRTNCHQDIRQRIWVAR